MFVENCIDGLTFMTAPNVGVTHAFTTRFAGFSLGVYESLNLGIDCGDDPVYVEENYGVVCSALRIPFDSLVRSRQLHGSRVRVVTHTDCGKLFLKEHPEADAMITQKPGVALIVYTADCVPILLHDPVRGVIGAVHSGWRGTARDIVGTAVRKISKEFGCSPIEIRAAIGPCISKCCYETDSDVADAFRKTLTPSAESCISKRGEKYMIDLKEANRLLLNRAGLVNITVSDECTSCKNDKYWSHRRAKGRRGSQAAVIQL